MCSDPAQVAWARSFLALLAALAAYVKAFHTTGLAWNARGVPVEQYEAARAAPDAGAAAAGAEAVGAGAAVGAGVVPSGRTRSRCSTDSMNDMQL
mgnify:CR=1 FL=1